MGRLSCNGCRVLRKACTDSCSIRCCLDWIKTPDAQSNATVFLAKFYGRAGLLNLVNAAPESLRPAVFRSLLYEACGRMANPIYGSVGLLWSGNWNACQAAVEAVLKGEPIVRQISDDEAANAPSSSYDIRHVAAASSSSPSPPKEGPRSISSDHHPPSSMSKKRRTWRPSDTACSDYNKKQPRKQQPPPSQQSTDSDEAAPSHVSQAEQSTHDDVSQAEQWSLDLTLGFAPHLPMPQPAPTAGDDASLTVTGTG
jgi:hypothetical protein